VLRDPCVSVRHLAALPSTVAPGPPVSDPRLPLSRHRPRAHARRPPKCTAVGLVSAAQHLPDGSGPSLTPCLRMASSPPAPPPLPHPTSASKGVGRRSRTLSLPPPPPFSSAHCHCPIGPSLSSPSPVVAGSRCPPSGYRIPLPPRNTDEPLLSPPPPQPPLSTHFPGETHRPPHCPAPPRGPTGAAGVHLTAG
jgi:hypothetical protein